MEVAKKFPGKQYKYGEYNDVIVTMRDGVRLVANVRFPLVDGKADLTKKYPVMLYRSGYHFQPGGGGVYGMDEVAAVNGYAIVAVAARGTFKSEGEAVQPLANEGWGTDGRPNHNGWGTHQDGVDIVKWVLRQPWCNGQVLTTGISWLGASQLLPLLTENIPGLVTSAIIHPAVNHGYGGMIYDNGFFQLATLVLWTYLMEPDSHPRFAPPVQKLIEEENARFGDPIHDFSKRDLVGWTRKYGLKDLPVLRHVPFYKKWVENYDNIDFFDYSDTSTRPHNFDRPHLFVGGLYDMFLNTILHTYERAVKDAPTPEIAKGHHLLITPNGHMAHKPMPGEHVFTNGRFDYTAIIIDWFEKQRSGIPAEVFDKSPVTLYVMGEEKWRAEQTWPLPDTQYTEYYLHSGGKANTSNGDGVLSTEKPGAETSDQYVADPFNPVPSLMENNLAGGCSDGTANQKRDDVLVYTTPVLEEDVEVIGWINATLYAATSATDTDFFMKLFDVHPDGKVLHLCTGGVRGRYRKDRQAPEAMVPGQIEKLDVQMRAASCVFKKGHQIRVEVLSSDFPLDDINPNAFVDLRTATEKDYVVAQQTIYHDAEHPSSITLPIIPVDRKREWIDWPYYPELTGGFEEFRLDKTNPNVGIRATDPIPMPVEELPVVE